MHSRKADLSPSLRTIIGQRLTFRPPTQMIMRYFRWLLGLCYTLSVTHGWAQELVPVATYGVGADGRVQLGIDGRADRYYVLYASPTADGPYEQAVSIQRGQAGAMVLTEGLAALPPAHYQVVAHPVGSPADVDGDGADDLTELAQLPVRAPLNAAPPIDPQDGCTAVDSFATFKRLSISREEVVLSEFLNGKSFVKYIIDDFFTDQPKLYFIDSERHDLHKDFAQAIGIDHLGDQVRKGQVIFHPTSISAGGTLGTFAFNYSNGHGDDFEIVQRTHELLATSMPLLKNNLSYFVTERSEDEYARDSLRYADSRIPVLFEADVYAELDYWGLHPAEGYGFFRKVGLDELPGPRDIVLYETLPNDLPRVAGIMTSVVQTPLSHVNLRAIQNDVPNAFIRDPLADAAIAGLLGKPVYFRVGQENYTLREASLEEVNAWFDNLRPAEPQRPPLNLDHRDILPLNAIEFGMYDGFGAKCANVATMHTFGFPAGTIPDGFGVPFYFYQEFMRFNGFFTEVETLLADPAFLTDRQLRDAALAGLRDRIESADLPDWMWTALAGMHRQFPPGTSVRCRSSTNNEDLPGFNGAGLYTSKTQHPNEGHIAKSIRQVYASLWNLRAFEEREFYRIDHFAASMGVLCHPNYSDEQANGVGVSVDPLYGTDNTFYLNTQVGEELITNPNGTTPEEILLARNGDADDDYILVQRSNLAPGGEPIMDDEHLADMRTYFTVIHEEFARLYRAMGNPTFAMDIEYKITAEGQLSIKQARPWVSYVPVEKAEPLAPDNPLCIFPNPVSSLLRVACRDCAIERADVRDVLGRHLAVSSSANASDSGLEVPVSSLLPGIYWLTVKTTAGRSYARRFIKR